MRTRRGVYKDIENSPIVLTFGDKVYKFSSPKKRQIYIARVNLAILSLQKLEGKITTLAGVTPDLTKLQGRVYDNVYKNMIHK